MDKIVWTVIVFVLCTTTTGADSNG